MVEIKVSSSPKISVSGFDDNKVGTFQSVLAGIGAGLIDIPKGAFSLGASLIDLGLGTNKAAQVESFFDNLTTPICRHNFETPLFPFLKAVLG